jgi:hypothetical protein
MSEAKLQEARELIKEGRYDEARELLHGVDDPVAREMLVRLKLLKLIEDGLLKGFSATKAKLGPSERATLFTALESLVTLNLLGGPPPNYQPHPASKFQASLEALKVYLGQEGVSIEDLLEKVTNPTLREADADEPVDAGPEE